jgi:hypothetical protein
MAKHDCNLKLNVFIEVMFINTGNRYAKNGKNLK